MTPTPTIQKNVITIKKNRAYYNASLTPLCGEDCILLDKTKTDDGQIEILNPQDRKTSLKIKFA